MSGDGASGGSDRPADSGTPGSGPAKGGERSPGPAKGGEKNPSAAKDGAGTGKAAADSGDPDASYGSDRRAFGEAYDEGRNLTTDGPMAFIRDSLVDEMHVGDRHYHYAAGRGGKRRSGSVHEDELEAVRARYVPVAEYDEMLSTLGDRRVLVLCGEPGTGRFTTAVRLLDDVGCEVISRFDAGQDIGALTSDDCASGHGYVVELLGAAGASTSETQLDKLRNLMEDNGSSIVLIAERGDLQGRHLDGYAVPYSPPESDRVLENHLGEEVREDGQDAQVLLRRLEESHRLRRALGPAPRPVEVARMARLLAEYGRRAISLDEVEAQAAQLVHRQVVEWFAGLAGLRSAALGDALRLAAFRIALAVLNRSPYNMVAEAGRRLADLFVKDAKGVSTGQSSLFADDHQSRLPKSRAEVVEGLLSVGLERVPVGLAKYADDRLPVVLLSYVWKNHHGLRNHMVGWLKSLSKDGRPMVWVRAAQATGLFCSLDFHSTFEDMIRPGAAATGRRRRQRRLFAAVALDQAARDERVADAVDERLRNWRRYGTDAERWTAASALGYDLGRRSIDSTFEELRVLGTPSEQQSALDEWTNLDLVRISGYSVANLFAFGEVEPVLGKLAEWTSSDRQSVRKLAWWAMLHLIHMHGFTLDQLGLSAGRVERPTPRTREHWPLLLALQDEQPHLAAPIADLLRWGLRGRRGDFVARYLFGPWIRAAEKDGECLRALTAFVPHLVHDEVDVRRLHHLVNRLRHDWSDPLKDDAARLLEAAIRVPAPREEAS
ncbi:hypothetical protein AB0I60_02250 [Actinosynnema sp. NPDC050436]|uniref:hypothetical protein n=1 Tax=Actinosynnema sp. NPDC050436 TaxID=3155659 RepID=UPI00340A3924